MTFRYDSVWNITKLLNLHNIKCSSEELNIIKNKDSYIKKKIMLQIIQILYNLEMEKHFTIIK